MAELLENYEHSIEAIRLIPSNGGRFEVTVDGNLLYSKLVTGRHTYAGELNALLREYRQEEPS